MDKMKVRDITKNYLDDEILFCISVRCGKGCTVGRWYEDNIHFYLNYDVKFFSVDFEYKRVHIYV